METRSAATFATMLDRFVSQALARDVSPQVAEEARRVTGRVLGRSLAGPLSASQERRAQAYFSAVVRRRAVRAGQPARGAVRFVVAAVVEDLRASGRDGEAIWDQLQRGWSDSVPHDVLEEYRLRLCG
ncbi:MAG: hypothetical protein WCJ13_05215 [Coriobacteriia bacterium]